MRGEKHIVVVLYEPIAYILRQSGDRKEVHTAKVLFSDKSEVLIIPYEAPSHLWNNLNRI
jgi:hypothetical protein